MDMEALVKQITDQVMEKISNVDEEKGQTLVTQAKPSQNAYDRGVVTGAQIGRMIDHTLLKADSTKEQVIKICKEAVENNFATVCINPTWVPLASKELAGTNVGVTTVVGFPLGATSTFTKIAEARDAIASGATEIDMVMNVGAMKSGDSDKVKNDIQGVVDAVNQQAVVKVIIETGFLTDEEKKKACMLAKMAGADFVKTSTGFGPGCATPEDIKLMRETVGPDIGVKASACVRDLDTARKMVAAGANRIGASAGVSIVRGESSKSDY
jgi:deoxyribose-phosphate aldolase